MTRKPMLSNMFDAYLVLIYTADQFICFCTFFIEEMLLFLSVAVRNVSNKWDVHLQLCKYLYHQLTLVMLHGNCDLYVIYIPHKNSNRLGTLVKTNIEITMALLLWSFKKIDWTTQIISKATKWQKYCLFSAIFSLHCVDSIFIYFVPILFLRKKRRKMYDDLSLWTNAEEKKMCWSNFSHFMWSMVV